MVYQTEQTKSFSHQLIIQIIIAVVIDNIKAINSTFVPWQRLLIVIIFGIGYTAFYLRYKRPKQIKISSKALNLLTAALVIAIILIAAAALILGLTATSTIFMVGWLILMIILARFAQSLPASMVAPKTILTGIAAICTGAALSIGGVPVIDSVISGPVNLTIYNNCDTPLIYDKLAIDVPARSSQTIEAPAVSVTIKKDENLIYIHALIYDLELNGKDTDISFNNKLINPGDSLRVNLWENKNNELVITCR